MELAGTGSASYLAFELPRRPLRALGGDGRLEHADPMHTKTLFPYRLFWPKMVPKSLRGKRVQAKKSVRLAKRLVTVLGALLGLGAALRTAHGANAAVLLTHELDVHVQQPELPTLDLIDVPGLVVTSGNHQSPDTPQKTLELAKSVVDRYKDTAMFLVVIDSRTGANVSLPFAALSLSRCVDISKKECCVFQRKRGVWKMRKLLSEHRAMVTISNVQIFSSPFRWFILWRRKYATAKGQYNLTHKKKHTHKEKEMRGRCVNARHFKEFGCHPPHTKKAVLFFLGVSSQ